MALFRLFVDSSNGVDIDPEYDYKENDRKIEDRHRPRSGNEFVYRWGSYDRFEFTARYVNSAFRSMVNSWWDSNTELLFMETSGTAVSSVLIINGSKPIDRMEKPYTDLFRGKIVLGTY